MAKVKAEQRQRMRDTLISCLVDSAIRPVKEFGEDCMLLETPQGRVTLFYHSDTSEVEEMKRKVRYFEERDMVVSNIFYKDSQTFFVPLTRDQIQRKFKRSFSELNYNQLMGVVSLRDKEQFTLAIQAGDRTLTYYQPDTTHDGGRLREEIVTFYMKPFEKDYAHIPTDRAGYRHIAEQDGERYKDFAVSADKKVLNGAVYFKPGRNNRNIAVLTSAEPTVQATLL